MTLESLIGGAAVTDCGGRYLTRVERIDHDLSYGPEPLWELSFGTIGRGVRVWVGDSAVGTLVDGQRVWLQGVTFRLDSDDRPVLLRALRLLGFDLDGWPLHWAEEPVQATQ